MRGLFLALAFGSGLLILGGTGSTTWGQEDAKGYAGAAYKPAKDFAPPGEGLAAAAAGSAPDLDWVYIGRKGGHHLGKAGKGHIITGSGGVFLSTTLTFAGESANYWAYKIEGYQEGGKDFYHGYPKAGGGTILIRRGPAPAPWVPWDDANRGKNSAK